MAVGSGHESEIVEFFNAAERTKLIARKSHPPIPAQIGIEDSIVIASMILGYDIILTLPDEIRYVWSARWSFARVVFHINRVWGSLLLGFVNTCYCSMLGIDVKLCHPQHICS